ncbi:MAG: MscL family protein [Gemmatimonadaceae bacterium]|nr:MscL family protein [Gemmatimonadaceae bacterium]
MAFLTDFLKFLKKFGVLALAVGVLLGEQVNNLEKALIDDVIMPLLDPLLPSGDWQKAVWIVGDAKVKIGHLLEAALHFTIVAFTVYVVLRLATPAATDEDALVKDAVAK